MIRWPARRPGQSARVIGVLAAVLAAILAAGVVTGSSLAAARHPVPVIDRSARAHAAPVIIPGPADPASSHCFGSYASGPAGRMGPITDCWTTGAGTPDFAVGGSLTRPLYPGTSQRLNLTFTNRSFAPVTIPRGGIPARDITITSRAHGCASSNFAVVQGLASAVTIPAGRFTPVSLSALRVPQGDWPVIAMIETNTNQDSCQDAELTLTYSGIEASR